MVSVLSIKYIVCACAVQGDHQQAFDILDAEPGSDAEGQQQFQRASLLGYIRFTQFKEVRFSLHCSFLDMLTIRIALFRSGVWLLQATP